MVLSSALHNPPVTPDKALRSPKEIKTHTTAGAEAAATSTSTLLALTTTTRSTNTTTMSEPEEHLLQIHRCRFLDWEPHAVMCMAASASGQLLAVARENGAVEIRRVNEKYRVQEVVQVTNGECLIRALAWSRHGKDEEARLFVGSLDTSIYEIDIEGMQVRHRQDSYGGPVWCLAAARDKDVLAVGCEDGSVKLFDTADGQLEFTRGLPTINARILSLAWQLGGGGGDGGSSSSSSSSSTQNNLFVGAVDGTIRHMDTATGHSAYRMTVEGRNNSLHAAMIWSLKALPDGTLVSGDSMGSIHIWDGAMGTLRQSFAVHEADVLALESNAAGDTVFASGVDSKLVCLRRHAAAAEKWVVTASNRAHSHDVTALAVVNMQRGPNKRVTPVLVSGGKDTKICTYRVQRFADARPRYFAPYPYHPVVSVASNHPARLLLMQHDRQLHLWRLGATKEETAALLRCDPKPVLEIHAAKKTVAGSSSSSGGNNLIVCSALSPDGRFLVYATSEEMRLFELKTYEGEGAGEESQFLLRRIKQDVVGKGITAVRFTAESKKLVVATREGRLLLIDLGHHQQQHGGEEAFKVLEAAVPRADEEGIVLLSCSGDGRSVVVARLNGEVAVYRTKDMTLTWQLPRLDSAPTALAYHPEADVLVVACVSNRFYLFDSAARQLTDWSQDLGDRLPRDLVDRPDCISGICFNPDSPNSLLLHGFGFLCYVDLDRPMCKHVHLLPETHPAALAQKKKRKFQQLQKEKEKKKKLREQHEKEQAKKQKSKANEKAPPPAVNGDAETANGSAVPSTRSRRRTRSNSILLETETVAPLEKEEEKRGTEEHEKEGEEEEEEEEEDDDDDDDEEEEEEEGERSCNFKLHLGYQGILAVQALGKDELLLVEEPWLKIVSKLPDVLHRHRYGT